MHGSPPGAIVAAMRANPCLLLLPLGAVALLATAAPAAAPSPTVSLWPKTVARGQVMLVTGGHWGRRVRVELLVGPPRSEADHVAWATTTAGGQLRRAIRVSRHARTGRFVLLACRRECRIKRQASFRIVASRGAAGTAAPAGARPAR